MSTASAASRHFAQSYVEARDKFLAATHAAGLDVQSHEHPLRGRDGEVLAMDVARFGAADASAMLLISSACHGVEGYCGSGVQHALLGDPAWHAQAQEAGIALLYVHEETRQPFVIEAHIEGGVAIAALDAYLTDKKLRIMVLRPRADLPQLTADPQLPHKAAGHAIAEARRQQIPYDFTMDYQDASKLFCSEVVVYPKHVSQAELISIETAASIET